jgi:hypothetical protein
MMLRRTTPGTIDPITDEETGATVIYADTRGVFTKIGTDYAMTHEVQSGDRMVTIDASAKPELTDKLVIGVSALSIVNIDAVNPAGTPVAYKLHVRGIVSDTISISQRMRIGASSLLLDGQPLSLATDALSSVAAGSLDLTGLPLSVQIGDSQDATLQVLASSLHVSGMTCVVQTGTVVNAQSSVGAGQLSVIARPSQASADVVAQAIASALAATGQQAAVQIGNSISLNASVKIGTVGLSGMSASVTVATHIDAIANIGADTVLHDGVAAQASTGVAPDIGASAYEVSSEALSVTTSSNADMSASVGTGNLLTTAKALSATVTGVDGTATMTTQPTVTVSDTTARIAYRVSGRSA